MASLLLFGTIPGGPELLIILLVVVVLLGVPLAVLALGGAIGYSVSGSRDGGDGTVDGDRVDELERELAETRAELAELREEREGAGDRDADDADRH